MTRRDFIRKSTATLALCTFPKLVLADGGEEKERSITLYNIHTGEREKATFWADGLYIEEELHRLDRLLRDYRSGEIHTMDRTLFDLLYRLQTISFRNDKTFHIVSGYRSPTTNEMLRRHSTGVAKHSLHMEGRAIDIYLPGVELAHLRRAALRMHRGGVGYYPKSGFVHIDTGRVRHWRG
ncbi:DUF882 domain-containing protein [Hydrogenimonas sp.]